MINSVYGNVNKVVNLTPVLNINAEMLHQYIQNIVNLLQNLGYQILTITTDNQKKFNKFSHDSF